MTGASGALNTDITYDPARLAPFYPDVQMLRLMTQGGERDLPYELLFEYDDDEELRNTWGFIEFLERQFRIPNELQEHASQIGKKYPSKIAKKGDAQGNCPRVSLFRVGESRVPHWKLELATYAEQIGTNMYPDALLVPPPPTGARALPAHTVREWDQLQAGLQVGLPPFELSRLANTMGVAVGVFAKTEDGRDVVLWRQRSNNPRLYENMPHVPLSFALNVERDRVWRGSYSLRELVAADYNAERAEELGVEQHFFSRLIPLAFCRDLPRGGKPQLFLEKRSMLRFEELRDQVIESSPEFIGQLQAIEFDMEPPVDASPELLAYLCLKQRQVQRKRAV